MEINKIIELIDNSRKLSGSGQDLDHHYERLFLLVDKSDYSNAFNECVDLMQSLYRNKDIESYIYLNKVKEILGAFN